MYKKVILHLMFIIHYKSCILKCHSKLSLVRNNTSSTYYVTVKRDYYEKLIFIYQNYDVLF